MPQFLEVPVLFLTFNRLDTTKMVFRVIKEARPRKLYIASDGPRINFIDDYLKVKEVRDFIKSNIDWECEVKTLFRDKNLGCKLAVSSAIDWFFKNEEMGIILEDDCLPDQSFFRFCEELLKKYKNDERVAVISGSNLNIKRVGSADYYFSKIPYIWGWATWRRAWNKYDVNLSYFPHFKKNLEIADIWSNNNVQNYWLYILDEVYRGKIDTWDYQLAFSLFVNKSFCICPNFNLVSNIGFGSDFTNTVVADKRIANLDFQKISFPLNHPDSLEYFEESSDYYHEIALKGYKIKKFLKKIRIFYLVKNFYIYIIKNKK